MEWWGNLLLQSAKGKKQFDELNHMMTQWLAGYPHLGDMFARLHGQDPGQKETPEPSLAWRKASEEFRKYVSESMKMMGMVPLDDHLELLKNYEALKKVAADQAETIRNLETLLAGKEPGPLNLAGEFQDLMKKQAKQLQELMEESGKFFKADT
jgi:hypothetical protein